MLYFVITIVTNFELLNSRKSLTSKFCFNLEMNSAGPDVLDDCIGQPFPSFVLVRVGLTLADGETGIEQQNSLKKE